MKKQMRFLLLTFGLFIAITAHAQNLRVTGNVTGSDGAAIPGVTVSVKGTTNGTITDLNGTYLLNVPDGKGTILFSFVGMKSLELPVNNQGVVNAQLTEDVIGLEEVIAVGYGTMKKSDLTGSVTTVKAEALTLRPTPTIAAALQGQASGVHVRTQSAAPGGNSSITIRGINSVQSSSEPLYVVDGIPLADINSIAPEDIESIEVLKDASATAIYGSRGANVRSILTAPCYRPLHYWLSTWR
jgi:TonB-dependent SusC/RagA subfamily outer membrane receptor